MIEFKIMAAIFVSAHLWYFFHIWRQSVIKNAMESRREIESKEIHEATLNYLKKQEKYLDFQMEKSRKLNEDFNSGYQHKTVKEIDNE